MRTVEKLIPNAISAVKEHIAPDDIVKSAYKGYISSLGAGIIQSGLLPTLAMYKGNAGSDKKKAETGDLLQAILSVIKTSNNDIIEDDLFNYALNAVDKNKVKKEIMDASIAIKLAIRTFKLSEE